METVLKKNFIKSRLRTQEDRNKILKIEEKRVAILEALNEYRESLENISLHDTETMIGVLNGRTYDKRKMIRQIASIENIIKEELTEIKEYKTYECDECHITLTSNEKKYVINEKVLCRNCMTEKYEAKRGV